MAIFEELPGRYRQALHLGLRIDVAHQYVLFAGLVQAVLAAAWRGRLGNRQEAARPGGSHFQGAGAHQLFILHHPGGELAVVLRQLDIHRESPVARRETQLLGSPCQDQRWCLPGHRSRRVDLSLLAFSDSSVSSALLDWACSTSKAA